VKAPDVGAIGSARKFDMDDTVTTLAHPDVVNDCDDGLVDGIDDPGTGGTP
jgi:hypothetical protein